MYRLVRHFGRRTDTRAHTHTHVHTCPSQLIQTAPEPLRLTRPLNYFSLLGIHPYSRPHLLNFTSPGNQRPETARSTLRRPARLRPSIYNYCQKRRGEGCRVPAYGNIAHSPSHTRSHTTARTLAPRRHKDLFLDQT